MLLCTLFHFHELFRLQHFRVLLHTIISKRRETSKMLFSLWQSVISCVAFCSSKCMPSPFPKADHEKGEDELPEQSEARRGRHRCSDWLSAVECPAGSGSWRCGSAGDCYTGSETGECFLSLLVPHHNIFPKPSEYGNIVYLKGWMTDSSSFVHHFCLFSPLYITLVAASNNNFKFWSNNII